MSLRRVTLTAVGMILTLSLTACGGTDDGAAPAGDGATTVAAGFYPLAWVAEQVGGDDVDVTNLTTPGQEPHDLELGINQTAVVTDAQLVIHAESFQPAVDKAVESTATGEALEVGDVIELHEFGAEGHDHSAEGHDDEDHDHAGHDHGDRDPHFWLDPVLMADFADQVASELGEIDPDNAESYTGNAEDLRGELEKLDRQYADGLADCARHTVVVSHNAFGYWEKYDLEFAPIAGLSPEATATAADLAELNDLIRDEGITTVFSETLVSNKPAERLATDAGVAVGVLDPIEGLSDESADEDYLSLMRANLENLTQANGC